MAISLKWLNDYVDIKDIDPIEMANKITKAGINVEEVKRVNISNLIIGYIEEVTPHRNSDHLNVCQVNVGDSKIQIVCGASNVAAGQKVIVALVGAILPGNFEIKKSTIRDVESNGMICALFELGLEDKETNYNKGIHVLGDDAVVGSDPIAYLGLDDVTYELDLNPNRSDCMNHIPFAYEVAAVLNKKVILPETKVETINESINSEVTLRVDTNNCKLYEARMVSDVVIGESPTFIKNRLASAGMRSINNVVDISNYIMLEYGQPLHFFDKDKLGNILNVRMASDGEQTITLDGKNRSLTKDDIVITNNTNIVAIAGVMGCANSDVSDLTKNILIESAIFNPYNVRYTSIRLDLRSEASLRFEKELNYEYTTEALNRACYLLNKYASGKVLSDTIIFDEMDKKTKIATVTRGKINAVLGMNLTNEDIMNAFDRLDFEVSTNDDEYIVKIPNRRVDVSIKEDLIEEVGRLYGYDNIIGKMPLSPIKKGSYSPKTLFIKQVSKRMRSLGLNEVRTYTLISKEENDQFAYQRNESINLQMPLSSDKSIVRESILSSLLKTIEYNYARSVKDINIYEISNTYYHIGEAYIEEPKLGFAMLGNYLTNNWEKTIVKVDFYLIKGVLENLLNYLGFNGRYNFVTNDLPKELHPGISCEITIDGKAIGYLGMIHPSLSKLSVFVCEIRLKELSGLKVGGIKYREPSKFPSISRDVAFVLDEKITSNEIISLIKKTGGKILDQIDIFDVYTGPNIGNDKKSIAISLVFNDITKTLKEDDVTNVFDIIIKEVETKLGAVIRNK